MRSLRLIDIAGFERIFYYVSDATYIVGFREAAFQLRPAETEQPGRNSGLESAPLRTLEWLMHEQSSRNKRYSKSRYLGKMDELTGGHDLGVASQHFNGGPVARCFCNLLGGPVTVL